MAVRTMSCLLYTSDAADERSSVDLGGRRIIKKKKDSPRRRTAQRHLKKYKMEMARYTTKNMTEKE